MESLNERYRPERLCEIIGQPCVDGLIRFAANPYPCCIALEGPTGVGKTTAAMALANELGNHDGLLDSVYVVEGANFDAEAVRHYLTGPWGANDNTPLRYSVKPGFHVLVLEELEYMNPTVARLCKTAFEQAVKPRHNEHGDTEYPYRLIIVATSNDMSALPVALRHRFAGHHYMFRGDEAFAEVMIDWLALVWQHEMGDAEMPQHWMGFGWDLTTETFSARLALETLGQYMVKEGAMA